jgi:mono/diheme cytochrome c family protein
VRQQSSWAVFWGLVAAGVVTIGLLIAIFAGYLLGHYTHTRTKTVAQTTVPVARSGSPTSTVGSAPWSGSSSASTGQAASTSASTGMVVFQQSCSSCHKLAAAKATFGTYGPDLDQLKPSKTAVEEQVTNGGGIMPAFGKDGILTAAEIKTVATYVAAEAGK